MNIAVVIAHPDDAEYMVGGTIIKYARKGHRVTIIICTNGNIGHPTLSKEEIAKVRLKEAVEGANVMGADVINLNYDDEFLPDNKKSRLKILDALRKVAPNIVFTHHPNDFTNADHRVVSNIVIDMSYQQMAKNIETEHKETKSYPALYYIDIPAGIGFEPTDYVDITDVIELKKKALLKHESQKIWMNKLGASKDFIKSMKIQSAFRGLQFQCDYAEAFISMNKYPRTINKKILP